MTTLHELPVLIELTPELVIAVKAVAEKRRPSNDEVQLGISENKVPTLDDLAGSALVLMAMLATQEAAGQSHILNPLADGSLISLADIEARAEALNLKLCSGQAEPVELTLPFQTVRAVEMAADISEMTIGEIVCSSLIDYLALEGLMEERGGPHANVVE